MSDANESRAGHDDGGSTNSPAQRPNDASAARQPAPANSPAAGDSSATAGGPISRGDDDAGPICEICGAVMFERHCKILCPVCGYQRDCSDP